jgi:hypothetical protein
MKEGGIISGIFKYGIMNLTYLEFGNDTYPGLLQRPPEITQFMINKTAPSQSQINPGFKEFTWPPNYMQVTGIVLISIMNMMASAGGIGGGGIMTPFMMIFMSIPITECIPLANSFALISAIARFIVNFKQTHPFRPLRKIIDYEVVTLTMPLVYLGTMMGV